MTAIAAGLLWGLLTLAVGGPFATTPADSLVGPGADVPFVAQGPLLCGGAAAAMLERHHGARGVYGEDFAHLVRPEDGGIHTSHLVAELQARGYPTRVSLHDPAAARSTLESGLPALLLLGGGGPPLHYVVLVGMDGERAYLHDPNWGPSRPLPLEQFQEEWSASGFWMATVRAPPTLPESDGPRADPGEPVPPAVATALSRLREGDFPAAREAVADLRRTGPSGELASRVTATAHYLEGNALRALEAWNRIGEPRVDLVGVEGVARTRYHTIHRRMGLSHGALLRPDDLRRARRRLGALPAIRRSRVDIRPVENGAVEVQAAVLERRLWPGPASMVAAAGMGLAHRRARLEAGPFLGSGDRWSLGGSWHPAQRSLSLGGATPAPPIPGVVSVGLDWRREAHEGPARPEERVRGEFAVREWVSPGLRLGGTVGFERWGPRERRVSAGMGFRWVAWDDRIGVDTEVEGWAGAGDLLARVRSRIALTVPDEGGREWRVRAGWTSVTRSAPRLLWPGAGSAGFRDLLLRGHSLSRSGGLGGPTLAPEIVHGGLELRVHRELGPARVGGLLFADGAVVPSHGVSPGQGRFLDVGLGLVVALGEEEGQVTLAYGRQGWRLSTRVLRARAW